MSALRGAQIVGGGGDDAQLAVGDHLEQDGAVGDAKLLDRFVKRFDPAQAIFLAAEVEGRVLERGIVFLVHSPIIANPFCTVNYIAFCTETRYTVDERETKLKTRPGRRVPAKSVRCQATAGERW